MKRTNNIELYSAAPAVGLLKGFSPLPHQLEVDVVVPHAEQGLPGFGELLFIELSTTEAVVGRVIRYHAAGQLMTERGDAYLVDLARTDEAVPPPLMRQMLRYNLKIQLLGHLRAAQGTFRFSVGDRSFATLGSKVRMPSEAALAFLCNVGLEDDPTAVPVGHLVYGQREHPGVPIRFSVNRLKGKRSFVFARAGYGKSNLIKYLVSQLYSSPPDVGLLIFDPEGEYALPDTHGRSGLVNVPGLRERLSLYSNRKVPSPYAAVLKGNAYMDFGDFMPQDIVSAFVPAEKQEMVFANLLRGLDRTVWKELVAVLAKDGFAADDKKISALLSYRSRKDNKEDVSIAAIRNNLVPAIRRLHRPNAPLGKNILEELRQNRVVIVDVSLLGSEDSLAITGMIMRRVFQNNVRHLTDIAGHTVRCLAVLEEAQTILSDRAVDDRNVFVRWVKEGRKYGLGCILVTQQPSSISNQIISQGDNFFVLHLLNENDLQTLKRHNAYFSDDILAFIRSEPIPGNCYFWSAPNQPFVLSARVRDFESVCERAADRMRSPKPASFDGKPAEALIAKAVQQALVNDVRLWLYRVARLHGKTESGWIAFSVDYLQSIVAQTVTSDAAFAASDRTDDWLRTHLSREIGSVLRRHNACEGYAVLEGAARAVWVLPQSELKLNKSKLLRPATVDVLARI